MIKGVFLARILVSPSSEIESGWSYRHVYKSEIRQALLLGPSLDVVGLAEIFGSVIA
jgi:hypothetical protein